MLPISFATILKFSDAISGFTLRSNFCISFKAYIDLFIASICLFLVSKASCLGAKSITFDDFPDNQMDSITLLKVVKAIKAQKWVSFFLAGDE